MPNIQSSFAPPAMPYTSSGSGEDRDGVALGCKQSPFQYSSSLQYGYTRLTQAGLAIICHCYFEQYRYVCEVYVLYYLLARTDNPLIGYLYSRELTPQDGLGYDSPKRANPVGGL